MKDPIDLRAAEVPTAPALVPSVLDEAPVDDAQLVHQLEGAYAARLGAVVSGSHAAQVAARRHVEDLERRVLDRRRVGDALVAGVSRDPSYYLG